jgi:UDP-glucose 4-epimerase
MNILLTGIGGFIGGALLTYLCSEKYNIYGLSRFDRSCAGGLRYHHVVGNLCDLDVLKGAINPIKIDVVIDCAALIPNSISASNDYYKNIQMTNNLLESLGQIKHFVKISTIDVYGVTNGEFIFARNDKTTRLGYPESKFFSENLVINYSRKKNFTYSILRLTQVYGLGDSSNKFIPTVVKAAIERNQINIYGDGSDLRDYLHIGDLVKIISKFIGSENSGIYDVSTGISTPILSVVDIIQELTLHNLNILFCPRKKAKLDNLIKNEDLRAFIGREFSFTDLKSGLSDYFYKLNN